MTELEAARILKDRVTRKLSKDRLITAIGSTVILLFVIVVDIIKIIDTATTDVDMEASSKALSIAIFAVVILTTIVAESLNIRIISRYVRNKYTAGKNDALDYVHRRFEQFYESCKKADVPDAYIDDLKTCIEIIEAVKDKSNREIREENEAFRILREQEAEQLLNDLEQGSDSHTDEK